MFVTSKQEMAKLSVSSRNTEAFTCCSTQTVSVRLTLYNQPCRNGLKAGIYDFLYVFNCNILIKYVTITQNRQEKLYIKPNFINAAKTNDRPEPIVTYIFSYNNRSIRLCIRIGDSVRVSYE
jgi:hypothetical protein